MTRGLLVHGTVIALETAGADWCGVLLRGPSGSGKSDLALRMIAGGARLVADDQVRVSIDAAGRVLAAPPASLRGMLEVRGLGLIALALPSLAPAPVPIALVVDLVPPDAVPRLPERGLRADLAGRAIPRTALYPLAASAPIQVRLAVQVLCGIILSHPGVEATWADLGRGETT